MLELASELHPSSNQFDLVCNYQIDVLGGLQMFVQLSCLVSIWLTAVYAAVYTVYGMVQTTLNYYWTVFSI